MCWIYTPWLGRIVCGSHNRFSPVVVADLLPIWPKPFVCYGRGEEAGNRGLGEHRDWKILSAGIHHENSMRGRRYAQSAVWWRRQELNLCPKTVSALRLHV